MYDVQDIIYSSALRPYFLRKENQIPELFETVIPELLVFKAMLRIRDIDDKKKADIEHEEKKRQRRIMYGDEPEHPEEETKDEPLKVANQTMTSMKSTQKKKGKAVEIDPEELERMRKEAAFQLELKTYGRTWIWEGYYAEDKHDLWMQAAQELRSINP